MMTECECCGDEFLKVNDVVICPSCEDNEAFSCEYYEFEG